MMVAGIDIGAATAKAVILKSDKNIVSSYIVPTGHNARESGKLAVEKTLEYAELSFDDLSYIVSTGYGRRLASFANEAITEIICHAAGAISILPETRTIVDIGGQDSKVIGLDEDGNVRNFVMNDKCAAGTGRFLEVMAKVLDLEIEEMGPVSLRSEAPCSISSTCTVFAESEIVSLRAEGRSREDLVAGIHKAMAHRVAIMGKSVGFKKTVVFTGGVAKNVGIKMMLESDIKSDIWVPEEPQIMGAWGAAVLAKKHLKREGV